jgi:pyruvate/2-oxoacid:ferredoxin oxidoreductase beta subunit
MKVAAVAILCQDERVFESMIQAGTPCPIDGKIGKDAQALWSKYDHERPDYDLYVKRMKARKDKEEKIAKKAALVEKKRIEEEAKMTKEFEKADKEAAKEENKKNLKNKKNIEWKHPK